MIVSGFAATLCSTRFGSQPGTLALAADWNQTRHKQSVVPFPKCVFQSVSALTVECESIEIKVYEREFQDMC
jgi:hypothetical protein